MPVPFLSPGLFPKAANASRVSEFRVERAAWLKRVTDVVANANPARHTAYTPHEEMVKSAGYESHLYLLAYGVSSPLYDWITWWGFLPLGGERACRQEFARWLHLEAGFRVASLCCGTGSTELAMLDDTPSIALTGVDLGRGQIARAKRKLRDRPVALIHGDAAATGLPAGSFDRVLIGLALHEMGRHARLAVLREGARLCAPTGRLLAIDHARPSTRLSRLSRALWCFFWLPFNPEVSTSRDLQERGLDNEMRECGLDRLERHTTTPDWIEGILARPFTRAGGFCATAPLRS